MGLSFAASFCVPAVGLWGGVPGKPATGSGGRPGRQPPLAPERALRGEATSHARASIGPSRACALRKGTRFFLGGVPRPAPPAPPVRPCPPRRRRRASAGSPRPRLPRPPPGPSDGRARLAGPALLSLGSASPGHCPASPAGPGAICGQGGALSPARPQQEQAQRRGP